MKTALVHDWLTNIAGAEKVLEEVWKLLPSPIYTLIADQKKLQGSFFQDKEIIPSFLQKLPFATKYYRNLLPLFPLAIEQFDLSQYDLILSNSHAVAKGVLTLPHQRHICYCQTPMRYAWDMYHAYLAPLKGLRKASAKATLHYLRNWDIASLNRVDLFLANSRYIQQRIKKIYGRESIVLYPPVATERFIPAATREKFYLTVSRLVPYKRVDLIVEAFAHLPNERLIVIGDGPEREKIRQKAGRNVELLGARSDLEIADYMGKAKAFLFAAEEDFGISPVEAQSAGAPVIAFGKGGALETVVANRTGLFFEEQSVPSLLGALELFERTQDLFDPQVIQSYAAQFGKERFQRELQQIIASTG